MQIKDLDLNLHMERYLKLNEKHPININRGQMKHNSNRCTQKFVYPNC